MTSKEMLTAIINGTINDEVKAKAAEMLTAAEKKNGKRAEASAENRSANAAIAAAIAAAMTEGTKYAASEIVTLIAADYPDIKTAKVTAVMAVGIEDGLFEVDKEYKVGGKGRKVNGYSKVATATE